MLETNWKIWGHDSTEMNVRIQNESNKSCVNFHMMCCVFGLLIAKQIKKSLYGRKVPCSNFPWTLHWIVVLLSWPHSVYICFELIWCMNHHAGSSCWYIWPSEVWNVLHSFPETNIISRRGKLFFNYTVQHEEKSVSFGMWLYCMIHWYVSALLGCYHTA